MGTPTTTTNTPCPTECCSDDDCEDGTCENGNCVPHTTATKPSTASTTAASTTTACQFACCSNDDCEPGFICENGECKKPCTNDADCEGANAICNPTYDNCQYCSADNICENGCAADSNCWADMPSCSAAHSCTEIGYPALIKITVQTYDCTNCNTANEGGLELVLNDNTNLSCSSGQLDNVEKTDYNNGMIAEFYIVHNCCDLQDDVLTQGAMTELVNCVQCAG